jgi:hypothetical protein
VCGRAQFPLLIDVLKEVELTRIVTYQSVPCVLKYICQSVMEPKVLEGPPDESGVPRESPAKLLLEACNTYPDNTALVRE